MQMVTTHPHKLRYPIIICLLHLETRSDSHGPLLQALQLESSTSIGILKYSQVILVGNKYSQMRIFRFWILAANASIDFPERRILEHLSEAIWPIYARSGPYVELCTSNISSPGCIISYTVEY